MIMNINGKKYLILLIDVVIIFLTILSIISISQKPKLSNHDITQIEKEIGKRDQTNIIFKFGDFANLSNINLEPIIDFFVKGQEVELTIISGRTETTKIIKLEPYYSSGYIAVLSVLSIFFILPAIFLLLFLEDRKLANLTHWLLISGVMMIAFDWGSLAVFPNTINFVLRLFYSSSYLLLPILFLHFSLISPIRKFTKVEKYFKYIYYLLIAFLIPIGYINFQYLNFPLTGQINNVEIYEILHLNILKVIIIPLALLLIINLLHSYFTIKDNVARKKLMWIFFGFIIGFVVYTLLYRLPIFILGYPLLSESQMLLCQIISPITLFIAIYRYQFFNIHLIVKRSLVYSIVISILFTLYALSVYFLNWSIYNVWESTHLFTNALAAVIVVIVFNPLKVRVQNFVDKRFFKITYDVNKVVRELSKQINNDFSERSILNKCIDTLMNHIPVEGIGLFKYTQQKGDFFAKVCRNCALDDSTLHLIKEHLVNFPNNRPIIKDISDTTKANDVNNIFITIENDDIELIAPFFANNNELSLILILGKKKSTFPYNDEDIELIDSILNVINSELQRLYLQKTLMFQQEEITKLEEINQMKSFFVSSVSHELKTPLTAIKLFTEILSSSNNLPHEQKNEYFNIINGECDRLNRLINNILDFAKIERGTKVFNFEAVDLNSLIEKSIKICYYNLKMNNFKLEFNKPDGKFFVFGDSDTLTEVFINLIDNAIKYSADNKFVGIQLSQNNSEYLVVIEDKGIGIKPEEIGKIFEPYFRSSSKETRKTGGVGIGLSLVNNIIKAHHGEIAVESRLNEGTKFIIKLPILEKDGKNSDC